ncbi:hypothetical protein NL676_035247 [Syzygium grande]|nr:hypothetical protein NL676_035247 [Syzygium grande]
MLSGESKCLFDIEFKNGVLNIPYLTLYDTTESYFRNIIAFEQCYYFDTDKKAVAQLFNSLGKEVGLSPESYYFYSLSDKLIQHCQRPYNKWKATFKRKYCSSPWVVISVIAAVVLLFLTVAQTVCSVLSLI